MSHIDAETWIDLVIRKAPEIRGAGITSFTYDSCSITLAPMAIPTPVVIPRTDKPTEPKAPEPNYDMDPLSDPALGVADAGYDLRGVPGLIREISAD